MAPLNVAVIGAGPAGIYASDILSKSGLEVNIDLFERLPDGPGRGDSPRPWHVRFRGNLSTTLPKVACNSVDRTFLITQKRWNCNDTISIHKRLTGKLHATLLGNHDDAPYTIRSRPGQVEKHANTKPPPGSTGTTPAAPPPGRHHTTTSRKPTHNNTKGSGLNKPPQNPGLDMSLGTAFAPSGACQCTRGPATRTRAL